MNALNESIYRSKEEYTKRDGKCWERPQSCMVVLAILEEIFFACVPSITILRNSNYILIYIF